MMEVPPWMDKQLFQTILETWEDGVPNNGTLNFTTCPANPLAPNILSDTFRVHVEYQSKQGKNCSKGLIVKCPIRDKEASEDLEKLDFHSREQKVYEILIPKMYKKLKERFSPKFHPCPIKDVLVLEDLAKDGYVSCNSLKRLDFTHCKEVCIKIATFHATSVSCYNENPNVFENFANHVFITKEGPLNEAFETMINQSVLNVIEILTQSKELDNFRKFLLERADKVWKGAVESCNSKSVGLNVLNHGDLWTSNILFKYDQSGQRIDNVTLIDFQLTHFSSPVNDLAWFIWTSAEEEVLETHLDNLYNIYLQTLNSTLDLLGCEQRVTKQEFEFDIKASMDFVLLIISHQLPIFMGSGISKPTGEAIKQEKGANIFEKYYTGKYYRSILPTVCRQFEKHFL